MRQEAAAFFRRIVFVVGTAVGTPQASRVARADGREALIAHSLEEASERLRAAP